MTTNSVAFDAVNQKAAAILLKITNSLRCAADSA